jgi:hypothetical protein
MKRALIAGTAVLAAAGLGTLTSQATAQPTDRHGEERFSIISTTDPATDTVVGTGLFTAGGTDQGGSKADKIKFPDGSFTLKHSGTKTSHFDRSTCLLTTTGSGNFTAAAGTGAYKGIAGRGTYTLSIQVVFARTASGACDGNADPSALEYVVSGHGGISLP